MFERKRTQLLLMTLLLLLFPVVASAQSSSAVTGVVRDPAGAAIANATVTLTDTKTSKELTATTDDNGSSRVQSGAARSVDTILLHQGRLPVPRRTTWRWLATSRLMTWCCP